MKHKLPLAILPLMLLAACGTSPFQSRAALKPQPPKKLPPDLAAMYGPEPDGKFTIPAVPPQDITEAMKRKEVTYWTSQPAGTIIVDPGMFHLYYVLGHDKAMRYEVSVGKQGYGFSGDAVIPYKRKWPRWTPTPHMLKTTPKLDDPWRNGMPGGLQNPLGARALYLFRHGRDTLYRIHGTPYPWTIGHATTDGCIRLFDQDIINLYKRVRSGTKVIVRPPQDTGKDTFPPGTPVPATVLAARAKAIDFAAKSAAPSTGPASLSGMPDPSAPAANGSGAKATTTGTAAKSTAPQTASG